MDQEVLEVSEPRKDLERKNWKKDDFRLVIHEKFVRLLYQNASSASKDKSNFGILITATDDKDMRYINDLQLMELPNVKDLVLTRINIDSFDGGKFIERLAEVAQPLFDISTVFIVLDQSREANEYDDYLSRLAPYLSKLERMVVVLAWETSEISIFNLDMERMADQPKDNDVGVVGAEIDFQSLPCMAVINFYKIFKKGFFTKVFHRLTKFTSKALIVYTKERFNKLQNYPCIVWQKNVSVELAAFDKSPNEANPHPECSFAIDLDIPLPSSVKKLVIHGPIQSEGDTAIHDVSVLHWLWRKGQLSPSPSPFPNRLFPDLVSLTIDMRNSEKALSIVMLNLPNLRKLSIFNSSASTLLMFNKRQPSYLTDLEFVNYRGRVLFQEKSIIRKFKYHGEINDEAINKITDQSFWTFRNGKTGRLQREHDIKRLLCQYETAMGITPLVDEMYASRDESLSRQQEEFNNVSRDLRDIGTELDKFPVQLAGMRSQIDDLNKGIDDVKNQMPIVRENEANDARNTHPDPNGRHGLCWCCCCDL